MVHSGKISSPSVIAFSHRCQPADACLVASILAKSSLSLAKMHLAWLESVSQTMEMEAQFFKALAESGAKINQCYAKNGTIPEGTDIHDCYQDMFQTLTDAHLQRLENVAQLSHEFRRRLWEEI